MTHYRLLQTGDVDIEFDGELLAEESAREQTGPKAERWQDVRVYLTASDKWVIQRLGCSALPGDTERSTVKVCSTINQVRRAVTFKDTRGQEPRSYITDVCYDALRSAAEKDPRLEEAIVTRV